MIILSIHDGHNASAAILKDGVVISCVSEERINRKKFYWGWPHQSIDFVVQEAGISGKDIDVMTISHLSAVRYAIRKWSLLSSYKIWKPKAFIGHFLNMFDSFKKDLKVRKFKKSFCPQAKIFFCDHHLAHAASAYYFSGKSEALVVTCDALGDTLSHTAYSVKYGKWKRLVRGDSPESLGTFYGAITEGLGFKPNQHEGKIVGLAAYANPGVLIDRMRKTLVWNTNGGMHFRRAPYKKMMQEIKALVIEGFSKEEISSAAQALLEELMVSHVQVLLEKNPHTSLCLAGGVFANVKLNQRLVEKNKIEHIFIQPAMGDEGLVLGSALWYINNTSEVKSARTEQNPLEHVYFGTHTDNKTIVKILENKGRKYSTPENPAEVVAGLVAEGSIVGIFDGKMEFGPRALGARTIVADPRNKDVNDILNKRLKRSEFMPFAPSVIAEKADDIFNNVEPARHTAEFMTITFSAKAEWIDKVPAIVHIDGTARPQFVRKDRNANYFNLINEFYKKTGIPLLMNTSFNMHEEPIVSSPEDALRSLDVGAVDYILFNHSILVEK